MVEEKGKIRIRGIGKAAQVPDTVVLSLTLTAQNQEYSSAMTISSQQIEILRESIVEVGFESDDLKTTNFDVSTIYEDEEYREGNSKRYRQVFSGFECCHDLRLSFDFDKEKLNRVLDTIAASLAQPKISVAFTIKDTENFNDKILKSAAEDARHKAKLLCAAAGVKLGKLLEINYSWNEMNIKQVIYGECRLAGKNSFDFQPEEIKASDTVDFLWEIE